MLRNYLRVLLVSSALFFPFAAVHAESQASTAGAASIEVANVIDINTADVDSIVEALVGVGKVKAQAIIDYRNEHGPFVSVDELLEVKGIGQATLDKNRGRLKIN